MDRLVLILTVLIVACNAGHLGYGGGFADSLEAYPPLANRKEYARKSFYFFSAPEEDEVPEPITNRVTSTAKQNLQVVFIKAPEYNAYTNAALDLARQALQTKTVIYVLSRQPDIVDLERKVQEIKSNTDQKPEVRFIKYRTAEDAKQAQQIIRSQYEDLPVPASPFPPYEASGSITDYSKPKSSKKTNDALYTAHRPPFLPTGVDVVPGSSYLPPDRE